MKHAYFSESTVDGVSRSLLQRLEEFRRIRPLDFEPASAALLIIDMQRYFLEKNSHAYVPSAEPVIPRIRALGELFRARNLPVFLTRHLNTPEDAGVMAQWWADLITEEDGLSELVPEISSLGIDVIRKTQYDAFFATALEDRLRNLGISQLVITGVLTHLCIETTARSAFVRGFKVFLPIDGTATYEESFHSATLLNLSHGFALPVLCAELENILRAGGAK
jgi:isochorismate hydrolase